MSDEEIVQLAEEAKKPGKFNIMNVIKDRAFPSQDINVYLDEETAYKASDANEKLKRIDPADKEYAAAEEELKSLLAKLEESKYVFTIEGISESKREEISKLAAGKFPIEYREEKNIYTGETKREEIQNDERDNLFTAMLWSAHIRKIVSPTGDIQDHLSAEECNELRGALPIASSALVNQGIEKIRAASAVFMMTVDEDFLAKS